MTWEVYLTLSQIPLNKERRGEANRSFFPFGHWNAFGSYSLNDGTKLLLEGERLFPLLAFSLS